MSLKLWAASALLSDGWAENVEIEITDTGNIGQISTDSQRPDSQTYAVVIPGIANVHSHAHQRAMSGLGECAGGIDMTDDDSFWSWRKVMYHYLQRIQPEHLFHIASQLYSEMLKHGYTCVGEFQYLHHDLDGRSYDNPAEMSLQCLQAANEVGIGFTALPVLYRYGGFGEIDALEGQKRFINTADSFVEIVNRLHSCMTDNLNHSVGIAPHSLRAINQDLLTNVINHLGAQNLAAIHIHIAEQRKEVEDCLAWSQQRPVQWLLDHFNIDSKWCLIHATHMDENETRNLAQSGAVAGICPTTEANLGDGFFNAQDYFRHGGNWAIGTDSHISISAVEELRSLEYGQRLLTGNRNVLVSKRHRNTGRNLLEAAWQGGAQASGRKIGKIETGYRADLLVLDALHPRLYGRSKDDLLDSWIFSGNENLVKHVFVGGKQVIQDGYLANEEVIAQKYRQTLDQLSQ